MREDKPGLSVPCYAAVTYLLVVVVIGVDVVVVLLVSHVLLIAQLAVEAGVTLLLHTKTWTQGKKRGKKNEVKITIGACISCNEGLWSI